MHDDGRALTRRSHERLFDGNTWVAVHQHHAVRLEVRPERRPGLRFLEAKKRRHCLNQRDSGTEACERLSEFDADGSAAKDSQRSAIRLDERFS
jgi:hypothetical protein